MYKQGLSRILIIKNYQWFGLISNFTWALILLLFFFLSNVFNLYSLTISFFLAYFITTILFMPYYIKHKLVTKNIIFSRSSLTAWFITFLTSFIGLLVKSFIIKILYLFFVIYILFFCFKNLLTLESKNE